jgi:hypothetical protein
MADSGIPRPDPYYGFDENDNVRPKTILLSDGRLVTQYPPGYYPPSTHGVVSEGLHYGKPMEKPEATLAREITNMVNERVKIEEKLDSVYDEFATKGSEDAMRIIGLLGEIYPLLGRLKDSEPFLRRPDTNLGVFHSTYGKQLQELRAKQWALMGAVNTARAVATYDEEGDDDDDEEMSPEEVARREERQRQVEVLRQLAPEAFKAPVPTPVPAAAASSGPAIAALLTPPRTPAVEVAAASAPVAAPEPAQEVVPSPEPEPETKPKAKGRRGKKGGSRKAVRHTKKVHKVKRHHTRRAKHHKKHRTVSRK